MKDSAQVPKGRKPQSLSNPQLVTEYRKTYCDLVRFKLQSKPQMSIMVIQKWHDVLLAELERRHIKIQPPELLENQGEDDV